MSVLPDDQMNYVINYLTTKSTWDDLILYHKGPSNVKESRVMDLKLCYNTFKFKEGESLTQTFTKYKALMNDLVNDGIKLSKLEINTGFINGLPKKWLSFYQSLINTNNVKDSELASLFGKLKYKENLIDSIYETEKNKSIVSATPLSTAFFSSSIVQDFQDNPDNEEDTRSSHEYLNDLKEEYQARALLAKSKRFFKKASKASIVKNNGLIAEAYEWDEEEVSSDDNEMVAKDLVFVKSSADDTKVTIPGVERPWLSEAKGFILPYHDTGRILLYEPQRNPTDSSVAVTDSSATDYDSADESSVCSIPLSPLKKLDDAEPISRPKTIKSILSEESCHCQKKSEATARKIALLSKVKKKLTTTTYTTSDESGSKSRRTVTLTVEDMQKKKNDVKARTTLLLSLPDEHQLRFNKYKTARELWAAILKTFAGNEATKKTKKNLLKQQYGNFKAEGSETLEQTFNRLQVIIGQLQFMDIAIEQDDLNQKFLTSLAPEWLMHTIV
nr:retrovirus-related Pol polyprotein from transposon TNT 1-94 [Tanacetum cinerariifolium]